MSDKITVVRVKEGQVIGGIGAQRVYYVTSYARC